MYPISKSYSNFQIQMWKSQFLGIFVATRLYKFYSAIRFVPNLQVLYFLVQCKWKIQKLGTLSLPEKSYLNLAKFYYETHRNWVLIKVPGFYEFHHKWNIQKLGTFTKIKKILGVLLFHCNLAPTHFKYLRQALYFLNLPWMLRGNTQLG